MIPKSQPRLRTKLSALYRRCRCFSCATHPGHAVLLRRPQVSPSRTAFNNAATTLLYSTLIATGALLDAGLKRKRRKSLDNAIEQAEHNIAREQRRQAGRLAAVATTALATDDTRDDIAIHAQEVERETLPDNVDGRFRADDETPDMPNLLAKIYASQMSRDQELDHDLNRHMEARESMVTAHGDIAHLAYRARRAIGNENPSTVRQVNLALAALVNPDAQVDHHFSVNSPYSLYSRVEAKSAKRHHTPKRLVMKEYAIAILAAKMLLASEGLTGHERAQLTDRMPHLFRGYLTVNEERDAYRLSDRTTRPHLPSFLTDIDGADDLEKALLKALTRNIESYINGHITRTSMYAKLSHNLLYSPVPPTRVHFSGLIKWLQRAGELSMGIAVLDCFQASKERSDEISVVAALTLCRQAGDRHRFKNLHAMLEGTHKDIYGNQHALMLARPPGAHAERILPWMQPHGSDGHLRVKMAYSPAIWSALIGGYVKFDDMDTAYDLLDQMTDHGQHPDAHVVHHLMLRCIEKTEYATALAVWEDCAPYVLPKDPKARIIHGSIEHRCFRNALIACKESRQSGLFKKIYISALDRGLRIHALLPRKLPDYLGRPSGFHAWLRRKVNTLQDNCDILERDFVRFKMYVYASQMAIVRYPYAQIREQLLRLATPGGRFTTGDATREGPLKVSTDHGTEKGSEEIVQDVLMETSRKRPKYGRIPRTARSDASGLLKRRRHARKPAERPLVRLIRY